MADETEFAMGAEANCSDGPGGKVIRVIVDPVTKTVTHLVLRPGHLLSVARLVPLDLVERTAGGGIGLRCTVAQFGALEAAEETELADDSIAGLGLGGLGRPMGAPASVPVIVRDVVPLGEEDIERGEPVQALDGEIGRVEGVRVDPGDHRITHVLLQEGHLWGRREVVIPASAVIKVENGIWLNLTKEQLEELPPAVSG